MSTSGYTNIPFTVNVAMHAAIHAEHYVKLGNGGDGRLTFPGGGTEMLFSPANWSVPQPILVNFNGVGDAELMADVTNDYFVDGTGAHRTVRFIIDLSVTALPLDAWYGSTPAFDTNSQGNLGIAHNNLVIGHRLVLGATQLSGLADDVPFNTTPTYSFEITAPNGAVTIAAPGSTPMMQLGAYRIRAITTFCVIQQAEAVGHTIVLSDFTYGVTDAGGGTIVATVTAASIKSQGFACETGSVRIHGIVGPGPINVPTIPSGFDDVNVLGTLEFTIGGAGSGPNATGTASGGTTIGISGTSTAGFWGLSWDGSTGGVPTVDGLATRSAPAYLQFSASS